MHSSTLLRAALVAASFLSVSAAPAAIVQRDVEVVDESAVDGLVERGILQARAVVTVSNFAAPAVKVTSTGGIVSTQAQEGVEKGAGRLEAIVSLINSINSIIQKLTGDDTAKRMRFTQQAVADTSAKFPGSSVVVTNVGYQFTGTPLSKQSVSFNAKIGSNVSFDVLTWTVGTFTLKGDGGFQNWAYLIQGNCKAAKPALICT